MFFNSPKRMNKDIKSVDMKFDFVKDINFFFYDYSSRKVKDVVNNFSSIEEMFDETAVGVFYGNFLKLSNCDYLLDEKSEVGSLLHIICYI